MKKTIKIIDLIIIQANGKELPKKLKVDDNVFEYSDTTSDYILIDAGYIYYLFRDYVFDTNNNRLNDEVEIISDEEEFEDIEHYDLIDNDNTTMTNKIIATNFQHINEELDLLIKNQKKIIEKIKENK